jgi:hypothetical protein
MKIGVISDIHGNLLALEAVLGDLANRNVNRPGRPHSDDHRQLR